MPKILAIDPGSSETAYCLYDSDAPKGSQILAAAKLPNEDMLRLLRYRSGTMTPKGLFDEADVLAIEMIACYGMAVGASVFETVFWAGQFVEASSLPFQKVYRREVKVHLCNSAKAKDSNVNRVLLDRFGDYTYGQTGKGTKKNPSQLYGFQNDMFAALGVAVTYAETHMATQA